MTASEDQIRAVVDEVVRRHLLKTGAGRAPAASSGDRTASRRTEHASHERFVITRPNTESSTCVIEPALPCTHCGYCLSLGH